MNTRITLPKSAKLRSELALLLKFFRERIEHDLGNLGPHERHSSRRGKAVTQSEIAEAIGVTREWYALLECGAATGASTGLLGRLAEALMLIPDERATLFQSALPDLGPTRLQCDSTAALNSFSRLRSLSNRLWAATSVDEVLTTASERLADWFDDALMVRSIRRRESGVWEHRSVDDKQDRNDAAKVVRDLKDLLPTPEFHASLNLYPLLPNPGDIGTPDLHPLAVQQEFSKVYARRRIPGFAWRYARVRSRTGFTGSFLIVHTFGHSYSSSDLAVFAAFAELASLALS